MLKCRFLVRIQHLLNTSEGLDVVPWDLSLTVSWNDFHADTHLRGLVQRINGIIYIYKHSATIDCKCSTNCSFKYSLLNFISYIDTFVQFLIWIKFTNFNLTCESFPSSLLSFLSFSLLAFQNFSFLSFDIC